jgi:hypothetical protein
MIKEIDEMLEDWGFWTAGHVYESAIGYPSSTVEGRAIDGLVASGMPAHSICPEVGMPPRIARIDRLLRLAPRKILATAEQHYVQRDRRTGTWYWTRVELLHMWMHGAHAGSKK